MWLGASAQHFAADGAVSPLHLGLAAPFWPERAVLPEGIPAQKFSFKKTKQRQMEITLLV